MPSDPAAIPAAIGKLKPDTFLTHFRDIRNAKQDGSDASMTVARAKKAAKRDGVDLHMLKWAEELNDMDPDEIDVHLNTLRCYCVWLKLSLGAWNSGLEIPEPRKASQSEYEEWTAGQAGLAAGKGGKQDRDANPFIAGTGQHLAWDKGWARGFRNSNKKIAQEMVEAAEAKDLIAKAKKERAAAARRSNGHANNAEEQGAEAEEHAAA